MTSSRFATRSWLFAPGDSERKMLEAAVGPADIVILDLEDAVTEAEKPTARAMVADFLAAHPEADRHRLWVRVNPMDGPLVAIDTIHGDFHDLAGLRARAERMRRNQPDTVSSRSPLIQAHTPRAPEAVVSIDVAPQSAAIEWGQRRRSAIEIPVGGAIDTRDECDVVAAQG